MYICRRARAFKLSVKFRFAASSLEMFLHMEKSTQHHLQITWTNSSEWAAFSFISMIRENKSLIVCFASSISLSAERPTWDCSLTYCLSSETTATVCKICSSKVLICSFNSEEYVLILDIASSSGNYKYKICRNNDRYLSIDINNRIKVGGIQRIFWLQNLYCE